jgi:CRISPR-associated exonuclease Cas4
VTDDAARVAFTESDLIPLSALQHFIYCPRQCALIHVEQQWAENRFTAEGRLLHDRTDKPATEKRAGVRTATAMPIRSLRLGVAGVADVVEFHAEGGRLRPFPVEYKRGRPKAHRADEVQLCAQAMALEEMFATEVPQGALYYRAQRRRMPVSFDAELRKLTQRVADQTRALIRSGRTPPPIYEPHRCNPCSLFDLCKPRRLSRSSSAARWLEREIAKLDAER